MDQLVADLRESLRCIEDPFLGHALGEGNIVRDARVENCVAVIRLVLPVPLGPVKRSLELTIRERLTALPGITDVEIGWGSEISANSGYGQSGQLLQGVKNTVAVASGKGGVGKSTTAVNFTIALHAMGAKVGILDADIYGPNVPGMLGVTGRPILANDKIQPLYGYGVPVMSMGFLAEEGTAMIWRGPMVAQALRQLVEDVDWGELDYLIVDLPPGTGDAPLSLAQMLPLAGAVIASTPQEIALQDVRRGLAMFEKLRVPNLGVVENMSYFICSNCQERHEIFAHGGAAAAAETVGVPLLGEIPLDARIREGGDQGRPPASLGQDDVLAAAYFDAAQRMAGQLSQLNAAKPEPLPVL
jgi:ATP-binding protein involved in chromosome partitioning